MADPVETPTPETTMSVIPVDSPLFQLTGGQAYQINVETTARQVKTADGLNVETRLSTLERAVSANTTVRFAETIAERDALIGLVPGDVVVVTDATDDETVETGGASYFYLPDGAGWKKAQEFAEMDVVCEWGHVENRPTSAVAQIDLAVAKQHTHDNKTVIDLLTQDGAEGEIGNLLFNGRRIGDGKVWIARGESLSDVPPNLAENGLFFLTTPAGD